MDQQRLLEQFYTCNPRFIYDIKKYHADIYELFEEFKEKELNYLIRDLLKQGKKDKIFRADIDEEIICKLHINRINSIINGTLLPEKNITDPELFNAIIISLIGISTIKGHKLIERKINEI